MSTILSQIKGPNDIKKISPSDYPKLAQEIRDFLISHVSKTGGHLASNLGIVEITMALHLCLTFPRDKVVFDVGHQSYVHKMLTGRIDQFDSLRQQGGLCGFPKRKESSCDSFGTGHSSTSIAAAIGLATARDLCGGKETVVCVIGDGAFSGGLAYEALNNLNRFHRDHKNFIIILNDNKMSISENVGGMSRYFNDLRSRRSYTEFKENVERSLNSIGRVGKNMARKLKRSKDSIKALLVPGMFFENMGVNYYGPVDGHNIAEMVHAINVAKQYDGPILIHALTKKGKGYSYAEENPERFHGISPFDVKTGQLLKPKTTPTYTDIFSKKMLELAQKQKNIVAVTAAMPSGTGLIPFKKRFPDRFFDVGIAEEYAVIFAAGMAASGMKPFVAIYSSFLQRAYDQILHDVCIQNLPVTFCIDRSGLVGADGETHQGVFDISYLSHLPNMTLMAPKNGRELEDMLEFAASYDGPIAIKYARGSAYLGLEDHQMKIEYGKSETIQEGEGLVILAVGDIVEEAVKAVKLLEEEGIHVGLVNVRFLHPIDQEMIEAVAAKYSKILTVEENELNGGFGQKVSAYLHEKDLSNKLMMCGIDDCFIEHASVDYQRKESGIDGESLARKAKSFLAGYSS